jgi:glutathione S-transferase
MATKAHPITKAAEPKQALGKPTLTYFPLPGRAHAIRAALLHAKVDYVDNRIRGKQFGEEYRSDPTKAPLGSLPVLDIPGLGVITQSTAIARWAAKKSDLYPEDAEEQLIVEEVMEAINETNPGSDADEEVKKKKREAYIVKVALYMNLITARVKRSGGPFILGSKISIADLSIFGMLNLLYTGNLDYVPADTIEKNDPVVHALYMATKDHPISQAAM